MERHFALPITFAAALHAGLLFGFRTPAVPVTKEPVPVAKTKPFEPPLEVALDQPKSELPSDEVAVQKGDSKTARPTAPESPPVERSKAMEITISPVTHLFPTDGKIDLKPPGLPTGSESGIEFGTNLFSANQLDNPPRARFQVSPPYPMEAKTRGLTGTVTVEFTVDEHGMVVDPHVVNSTDRVFEDTTLRAVAKWRFEPGRRANRVVRFRMAVPVVFNLNEN